MLDEDDEGGPSGYITNQQMQARNSQQEARLLTRNARKRVALGQMEESVKLWGCAVQAAKKGFGKGSLEYAGLCGEMGDACLAAEQLDSAAVCYATVIDIMKARLHGNSSDEDIATHLRACSSFSELIAKRVARIAAVSCVALLSSLQVKTSDLWQRRLIQNREVFRWCRPLDTLLQIPVPEMSAAAQCALELTQGVIVVTCDGVLLFRSDLDNLLPDERLLHAPFSTANFAEVSRTLYVSIPTEEAVEKKCWGHEMQEEPANCVEFSLALPEIACLEMTTVQMTPYYARVCLAADTRRAFVVFYFQAPIDTASLEGTFSDRVLQLRATPSSTLSIEDMPVHKFDPSSTFLIETEEPYFVSTVPPPLMVYSGVMFLGCCAAVVAAVVVVLDPCLEQMKLAQSYERFFMPAMYAGVLSTVCEGAVAATTRDAVCEACMLAGAAIAAVSGNSIRSSTALLIRSSRGLKGRLDIAEKSLRRGAQRMVAHHAVCGGMIVLLSCTVREVRSIETLERLCRAHNDRNLLRALLHRRSATRETAIPLISAATALMAATASCQHHATHHIIKIAKSSAIRLHLYSQYTARRLQISHTTITASLSVLMLCTSKIVLKIETLRRVGAGQKGRRRTFALYNSKKTVEVLRALSYADAVRGDEVAHLRRLRGIMPHSQQEADSQSALATAVKQRRAIAEIDAEGAYLQLRSSSLRVVRQARQEDVSRRQRLEQYREERELARVVPLLERLGRGLIVRRNLFATYAVGVVKGSAFYTAGLLIVVQSWKEEHGLSVLQKVGRASLCRISTSAAARDLIAKYANIKRKRDRKSAYKELYFKQNQRIGQPKHRVYSSEEQNAAKRIQSLWKGYKARQYSDTLRLAHLHKVDSATTVQSFARTKQCYAVLSDLRAVAAAQAELYRRNSCIIQSAARGVLALHSVDLQEKKVTTELQVRLKRLRDELRARIEAERDIEVQEGVRLHRAICTIQRYERGRQARRRCRILRTGGDAQDFRILRRAQQEAAVAIQAIFRGYRTKKAFLLVKDDLIFEKHRRAKEQRLLYLKATGVIQRVGRAFPSRCLLREGYAERQHISLILQRIGRASCERASYMHRLLCHLRDRELARQEWMREQGIAALVVQKKVRIWSARKALKRRRDAHKMFLEESNVLAEEQAVETTERAAVTLQLLSRRRAARKRYMVLHSQREALRFASAQKIQSCVRGMVARNFVEKVRPCIAKESEERELIAFSRLEQMAHSRNFFGDSLRIILDGVAGHTDRTAAEEVTRLTLSEQLSRAHLADTQCYLARNDLLQLFLLFIKYETKAAAAEKIPLKATEREERRYIIGAQHRNDRENFCITEDTTRSVVSSEESDEFEHLNIAAALSLRISGRKMRQRRSGQKAALQTNEYRRRSEVQQNEVKSLEKLNPSRFLKVESILRKKSVLQHTDEHLLRLNQIAAERGERLSICRDFSSLLPSVMHDERCSFGKFESEMRVALQTQYRNTRNTMFAGLYAEWQRAHTADTHNRSSCVFTEEGIERNKYMREEATIRHDVHIALSSGISTYEAALCSSESFHSSEATSRSEVLMKESFVRDAMVSKFKGAVHHYGRALDVSIQRLDVARCEYRRDILGQEASSRLEIYQSESVGAESAEVARKDREHSELLAFLSRVADGEDRSRSCILSTEIHNIQTIICKGEHNLRSAWSWEESAHWEHIIHIRSILATLLPLVSKGRCEIETKWLFDASCMFISHMHDVQSAQQHTFYRITAVLMPGENRARGTLQKEEVEERDTLWMQFKREDAPATEGAFRMHLSRVAGGGVDVAARRKRIAAVALESLQERVVLPTLRGVSNAVPVKPRGNLFCPADVLTIVQEEKTAGRAIKDAEHDQRAALLSAEVQSAGEAAVAERNRILQEKEDKAEALLKQKELDEKAALLVYDREETGREESHGRQVLCFEEEAVWDDFLRYVLRKKACFWAPTALASTAPPIPKTTPLQEQLRAAPRSAHLPAGLGLAATLPTMSKLMGNNVKVVSSRASAFESKPFSTPSPAVECFANSTTESLPPFASEALSVIADPPGHHCTPGSQVGVVTTWWKRQVLRHFVYPPTQVLTMKRKGLDPRQNLVRETIVQLWSPVVPAECRVGAAELKQVLALYRETFVYLRCETDGYSESMGWSGEKDLETEGLLNAFVELGKMLAEEEFGVFIARVRLVVRGFLALSEGASPSLRAIWNLHAELQDGDGYVPLSTISSLSLAYLSHQEEPPMFISQDWHSGASTHGEPLLDRLEGVEAYSWTALGPVQDETAWEEDKVEVVRADLTFVAVAEFFTSLLLPVWIFFIFFLDLLFTAAFRSINRL